LNLNSATARIQIQQKAYNPDPESPIRNTADKFIQDILHLYAAQVGNKSDLRHLRAVPTDEAKAGGPAILFIQYPVL
jgi:hypothetical protein